MGGSGSGSWYRSSKKETTNDYFKWSVNKLVRDGFLGDDMLRNGTCTWSRTWMGEERKCSSISFTVNTTDPAFRYVQVRYTNQRTKEEFDYKIPLAVTSPNYGGKRFWWQCPIAGCGKRVAILYLTGRYFACRACLNLTYESQNEAPPFRFLTKAQNIHNKLGGSGCVDEWIRKPKGMHHKTFQRLVKEMNNHHDYAMVLAGQKFGIVDYF